MPILANCPSMLLPAKAQDDMRHLVTDYAGQLRLIFGSFNQSGIDEDRSARQ